MDRSASSEPGGADSHAAQERREKPPQKPRLLIAFGGERAPSHALRDGGRFALAVGAESHVLRVVAPSLSSEFAPTHVAHRARREAQRLVAAVRHARVLCDRAFGERITGTQLVARLGTFVEQSALRAAEIQADFISVSPSRRQLAATVQQLARATNRAILVPKRTQTLATLLAATDLEEPNTPLLRRAAQLGRQLDARVVALHGVPVDSGGLNEPSVGDRLVALDRAARSLGGQFESVVLRSGDPARDILEQARRHDADIILIGVRPHRLVRAEAALARIMRGASRSVLVAPLAGSDRGRSIR